MNDLKKEKNCLSKVETTSSYRSKLPEIAEKIIKSCDEDNIYTHIDYDPIPTRESVEEIIDRFKEILFPGYFFKGRLDPANLNYYIGQSVSILFDIISEQIANSIRHDCLRYDHSCTDCKERGQKVALDILDIIPNIRKTLATDISAAFDGDPAAKSHDEVIFSYPGIFTIMVYRISNALFTQDVPLLPRIMSEYAHSITGIDIHPGAQIGESFAIDHGTGIVIGETAIIGNNVRIYQGVTLGALSLPKDAGNRYRGVKRHPTIEDDVIIYAGATILGGDTSIGARSVIGGNVWITKSVPPDTKVLIEEPKLIYK
ncbi:MAG: serine acetyltransferase [Desulfobacterales bacterium]|jgi:serine O-acetyltransferase|nr:serine acetyltransferase [Desulfobacteraceae bacterium]MBT4364364.1 serine acetyltransferase [Desulfobacteraceae bacterium]MBT7087060.1 serine acetyltransferase [Desulfobacterales bacterium]MBT7696966.1 serine acetyltransferase [Desulfobacterales bacterium]